jgi:2-amino-4-hydroxy-6-hydroxymethyldihydropteridine diphosphokinase
MAAAYVALGANAGNREANLRMALRGITRMARVEAVSSLYESEPDVPGWEGPPQPPYYNAVCRIETGLEPLPLLRFLKALEEEIGRRPAAQRFAPRPIDLDLLLYEGRVIEGEGLTVPHPRMAERAFVLQPLAEIAPEVRHPLSGETAASMAKAAGDKGLRAIAGPGWDGVVGSEQDVRL